MTAPVLATHVLVSRRKIVLNCQAADRRNQRYKARPVLNSEYWMPDTGSNKEAETGNRNREQKQIHKKINLTALYLLPFGKLKTKPTAY